MASLYRFFPTKESVAEALLLQYAKRALEALEDLAARARMMTAAELSAGFTAFACALQAERRFAIDLAEVGGAGQDQRRQFRSAMLRRIGSILIETSPHLSAARSQAMAGVVMNVRGVGRTHEETPSARRRLLAETEKMLCL